MKQHQTKRKGPPKKANRSGREVEANELRSSKLLDSAIQERKLANRLITLRGEELQENDERTIEVVFSAGAEYRQWWGREKLDINGCKLERLNSRTSPGAAQSRQG